MENELGVGFSLRFRNKTDIPRRVWKGSSLMVEGASIAPRLQRKSEIAQLYGFSPQGSGLQRTRNTQTLRLADLLARL